MAGVESGETGTKEEGPHARPLLVVKPGIGEWRRTFSGLESSLAEADVPAVIGDQPPPGNTPELKAHFTSAKARARELYKGKTDPSVLEYLLNVIPLSLFRGALSIITLVESNLTAPDKPAVLAGHSMGAAEITVAAFLRPDLNITQLILINPASFTGRRERPSPYLQSAEELNAKKQNALDALFASWRTTKLFVHTSFVLFVAEFLGSAFRKGEKHARMLGAVRDGALYLAERLANGQIFAEAHGLANFDMLAYLDFIHAVNPELVVDVVYDEGDPLFPAERIRGRMREGEGKRDWIRLHETEGFGHYGPVKNPEYFADVIKHLTAP